MMLVDLLRYLVGESLLSNSGESVIPVAGTRRTQYEAQCNVEIDLPAVIDDWSDEWKESFDERAAILEFDGGLNRSTAEQRSEELQRTAFRCKISVSTTSGDHSAE